MSEKEPPEKKPPRVLRLSGFWIGVIAIVVAAAVVSVVMLSPSISPIPAVRDSDADGIPDALDVFPGDPNEWLDTDSDGVGDNGDVFPNDSSESADSDGDGVGDNGDVFPNDPAESRDSDLDGIGDNADFWDTGNGGLLIRIERFELIAGFCDFFSNCEPSFRLEVDIDGDGVTDVSRRADFVDFLDTMALVNPVEWTFDIPDNIASVQLIIFVLELDVGADDQIDVHPDSQFIAGYVSVNAPFAYKKFVTQGDQEPVGRLTYSVAATGV